MESMKITELCGLAWHDAITNVGKKLGMKYHDTWINWKSIEKLAQRLDLRFDWNGDIL